MKFSVLSSDSSDKMSRGGDAHPRGPVRRTLYQGAQRRCTSQIRRTRCVGDHLIVHQAAGVVIVAASANETRCALVESRALWVRG